MITKKNSLCNQRKGRRLGNYKKKGSSCNDEKTKFCDDL